MFIGSSGLHSSATATNLASFARRRMKPVKKFGSCPAPTSFTGSALIGGLRREVQSHCNARSAKRKPWSELIMQVLGSSAAI
eukprot:s918_g8.t1